MTMPPISEAAFMTGVRQYASVCGWAVFHPRVMIGAATGYPDLTLVRDRVVWAELKRVGGKPTPAQLEWLRLLTQAGGEAYLWTPEDWPLIEATLR